MKGNLIFFASDQQTIRHNYQLLHAVAIGLSTDRVGILADKLMFLLTREILWDAKVLQWSYIHVKLCNLLLLKRFKNVA